MSPHPFATCIPIYSPINPCSQPAYNGSTRAKALPMQINHYYTLLTSIKLAPHSISRTLRALTFKLEHLPSAQIIYLKRRSFLVTTILKLNHNELID